MSYIKVSIRIMEVARRDLGYADLRYADIKVVVFLSSEEASEVMNVGGH